MEVGDVLYWRTGFWGGEQGQSEKSWWPQIKQVRVVEHRGATVLVEVLANRIAGWSNETGWLGYQWDQRDAGERVWAKTSDLIATDPYVETDENREKPSGNGAYHMSSAG